MKSLITYTSGTLTKLTPLDEEPLYDLKLKNGNEVVYMATLDEQEARKFMNNEKIKDV